jgi:glucose-6-phosphate isomerase
MPGDNAGMFSLFSPVGVLPAAILGINVMELLTGAAAMNDHFRVASVDRNAILNYAGVCHLLEEKRATRTRVISVWTKALESFAVWYDQLLWETLGGRRRGTSRVLATTPNNPFEYSQRGQLHDNWITNVVVGSWRCDPLKVVRSELDGDGVNEVADRTLPDLMAAAVSRMNQAWQREGRLTAELRLPRLSDGTFGQLLQMMMIATVVEDRLIGLNIKRPREAELDQQAYCADRDRPEVENGL